MLATTGCGGGSLKEVVEESHPNGSKKKVSMYAGRTAMRTTFYFENGQMQSDRFFNKAGEPDSVMTIYRADGGVDKQTWFSNGTKHGWERSWYPSGQVRAEGEFKEDTPIGRHASYFEDGKVAMEVSFVDGRKHGEEIDYFANGNKKRVRPFANGDIDGVEQEFFENGKIKVEHTYVKGTLNGPFTFYSKNTGKKVEEGGYRTGQYHGDRIMYDERSGRRKSKATYDNGTMTFGEFF